MEELLAAIDAKKISIMDMVELNVDFSHRYVCLTRHRKQSVPQALETLFKNVSIDPDFVSAR